MSIFRSCAGAQGTLGDVFSGVVLNVAKPYRPGDWTIMEGGIEGRIVESQRPRHHPEQPHLLGQVAENRLSELDGLDPPDDHLATRLGDRVRALFALGP